MRFLALLLIAVPAAAHAEWNADLYGGVVYTPRSDITQSIGSPTGPADHTYHDVKWNNSAVLGARAGYWLRDADWYGFGMDVFQYSADVPTQMVDVTISGARTPVALQAIDFRVTAIAFDVVRLRYAAGNLEPYATAGPVFFKIKVTNRGNGELTTTAGRDDAWGYKAGAGLSWFLSRRAALFAEYRFTHVHAEAVLQGTITGAGVPTRFDLDSHHIVAGGSLRF
jgi:opacity protein-like surface antigen